MLNIFKKKNKVVIQDFPIYASKVIGGDIVKCKNNLPVYYVVTEEQSGKKQKFQSSEQAHKYATRLLDNDIICSVQKYNVGSKHPCGQWDYHFYF